MFLCKTAILFHRGEMTCCYIIILMTIQRLGQLYYHNWATKSFVKGQCMTTTLFAENGNMNLEHNIA